MGVSGFTDSEQLLQPAPTLFGAVGGGVQSGIMTTPAAEPGDTSVYASCGVWVRRMVAAAAGLGMFLAAMDIALNVALPSITRSFDTDRHTVQWIIVAFVATRAGLVVGAGSFGDRFGLRPVYLFGVSTYLASMFLIAFSPNLESMVGFRVVQALGTGCLYAVAPAIAAQVFPPHRRGLSMGFTVASQGLGMLAGTLGAGLLVRWFGWEAVFLGRAPFAVAALVLAVVFLSRSGRTGPAASFDAAGALTLTGALVCLVTGLRIGGSHGWAFPAVLVLLSLTPVLLGGFWRVEARAEWPVLPLGLLRVNGFVVAASTMFLAHLGVFVIWFIFPFYVEDTLRRGPFTLGAMLAAMAVANAGFAGVGGWLCDRAGTRAVGTAGLTVLGGGLLYMGFLDSDAGPFQVGLRIFVVGSGLGLFQAAAYALMLHSVPSGRLGTGSAMLSLTQAFGTVLSVAAIGEVLALSTGYHALRLASSGLAPGIVEVEAFTGAFQDAFRLGAIVAWAGAGVFLLGRRGAAK